MRPRTTTLVLVLAATGVGLPSRVVGQTKSLYDRLGGRAAISAVVDSFAARALADSRINKKLAEDGYWLGRSASRQCAKGFTLREFPYNGARSTVEALAVYGRQLGKGRYLYYLSNRPDEVLEITGKPVVKARRGVRLRLPPSRRRGP